MHAAFRYGTLTGVGEELWGVHRATSGVQGGLVFAVLYQGMLSSSMPISTGLLIDNYLLKGGPRIRCSCWQSARWMEI